MTGELWLAGHRVGGCLPNGCNFGNSVVLKWKRLRECRVGQYFIVWYIDALCTLIGHELILNCFLH